MIRNQRVESRLETPIMIHGVPEVRGLVVTEPSPNWNARRARNERNAACLRDELCVAEEGREC